MGKKRDSNDQIELSNKRHKKHKKHKKKKVDYDSDAIDVETEVPEVIKETLIENISAADKLKSQTTLKLGQSSKSKKSKKQKGKDSGTSSEEERWLDAIESGKLEEVDDELKKIKDPKLMTARQRAMYDRGADKDSVIGAEVLMSLPSGYKEKIMTAEAIQKAQIKSQKRKQMADEKREKDKKKTMERLLKKQDSKVKSIKNRPAKNHAPMISWISNIDGATLTFPPNIAFPLKAQYEQDPPKLIICAMPNCDNIKRYNCSKTNTPLCSFKCYKENVATIKNIIC